MSEYNCTHRVGRIHACIYMCVCVFGGWVRGNAILGICHVGSCFPMLNPIFCVWTAVFTRVGVVSVNVVTTVTCVCLIGCLAMHCSC